MRHVSFFFFFISSGILCFCRCTPEHAPPTLTFGIISCPTNLDPAYTQDISSTKILSNIFETLLHYEDSTFTTYPALAESVHVNPDATLWTFSLRRNVLFHDGAQCNAEAVKLSFDRQIDPRNTFYTRSEKASKETALDMIERIEILDQYTIRFHLKYPYVPFHHTIATCSGAAIVSPRALREYGTEFRIHPVGTGPFRLSAWNDSTSLELTANEHYWGRPPSVGKVKFVSIPRNNERTLQLIEGTIQAAEDVGASEVDRFYMKPDIRLIFSRAFGVTALAFNCQKGPFADARARKAVTYAFNREKFVHTMLRGRGTVAIGPLPPPMRSYQSDTSSVQFDPETATRLLVEAGYSDGFQVDLWCYKASERSGILPLAVQKDLKTVGIDVDIRYIDDWETYDSAVINGEALLFVDGWKGDTGDPDSFLYPIFHTKGEYAGGNLFHYSNQHLDDLLEQARQTMDTSRRQQLYAEAERIILSDQPCVFISYYNEVFAIRSTVANFFVNPLGFVILDRVAIR